jgi:cobalt-zinc-cadmium efflux system outer membrane protein
VTLDQAVQRLVRDNLDLRTQSFEIPEAEADVLTAGLRANPLLYADVIYLPYQRFSNARPGGPTQYDVSVTMPLDLNHKRRARTAVACQAKRVLEAQYQDAVRGQIANLYTAYVDVLAARETARFARASLSGVRELLEQTEELRKAWNASPGDVDQLRVQRSAAEIGLRDALATLRASRQNLALLLDLNEAEAESLEVRGRVRVRSEVPDPNRLVELALQSRPDLAAYRLGVVRAEADVRLALANRFQDVYLLYGPLVYQDNAPFQRQSASSGSAALTVPLPLFNRNQGNIQRARLNAAQTQTALAALERRVVAEVRRAHQEYEVTRTSVEQIERELLPAARKVRDETRTHFLGGDETILAYHEAERGYNDVVRQYRDLAVRHRRSMLGLNTAVGLRILP